MVTGEGYAPDDPGGERQFRYQQVIAALRDTYHDHAATNMVTSYDSFGRAIGVIAGTTVAYSNDSPDATWGLAVRKIDPLSPEGEYTVAVTDTNPTTGQERRRVYWYNTAHTEPATHAGPYDDWIVRFMLDQATYSPYAAEQKVREITEDVQLHPARIIGSGAVYEATLYEIQRPMAERQAVRDAHDQEAAAVAYEHELRIRNPIMYALYKGITWIKRRKAR
jgi:hypothetical protein